MKKTISYVIYIGGLYFISGILVTAGLFYMVIYVLLFFSVFHIAWALILKDAWFKRLGIIFSTACVLCIATFLMPMLVEKWSQRIDALEIIEKLESTKARTGAYPDNLEQLDGIETNGFFYHNYGADGFELSYIVSWEDSEYIYDSSQKSWEEEWAGND